MLEFEDAVAGFTRYILGCYQKRHTRAYLYYAIIHVHMTYRKSFANYFTPRECSHNLHYDRTCIRSIIYTKWFISSTWYSLVHKRSQQDSKYIFGTQCFCRVELFFLRGDILVGFLYGHQRDIEAETSLRLAQFPHRSASRFWQPETKLFRYVA